MTRNELTKLWAKVTGKFDALIGGAPEALDTLKEIADKLGDDDDAIAGLLSAVAGKANAADVYTKTEIGGIVDDAEDWMREQLAGKQDALTFDSAPRLGSSNPVTSGGVYTAIDNARTARAVAGWDTGQQAYVSRVSVDDMWSAFNTNGKVVELQLHDGSWNGSVLLCHGSYVDGNNARHMLFSGIVNGNLVEADVVGTAVSLSFLEISDVVTDLQALWTAKQDVSPITNAASGALAVNEYRDFGTVSALTVTLSGGTMTNYDLYKFAFTCASDSTTLTLPSGVKLPVDMDMEMANGRRFECVIDYAGCITFNCWD